MADVSLELVFAAQDVPPCRYACEKHYLGQISNWNGSRATIEARLSQNAGSQVRESEHVVCRRL